MIAVVGTNLAARRTAEQMVNEDVLKAFTPRYSLLAFLGVDTIIPRAVAAIERRRERRLPLAAHARWKRAVW